VGTRRGLFFDVMGGAHLKTLDPPSHSLDPSAFMRSPRLSAGIAFDLASALPIALEIAAAGAVFKMAIR